jgi:hypothetical protein
MNSLPSARLFTLLLRKEEGDVLLVGRGKPSEMYVAEGAPTRKGRESGALCMSEYFASGRWSQTRLATDTGFLGAALPNLRAYPLYVGAGGV